eukprot:GHRQ01025258.1.p1 GENE.GHRQ01025258.1~~GHRQ01025258.1.p1  ORF type:complete len:331 (-),score=43.01 GHRQ01025258.1:62-1054(-)
MLTRTILLTNSGSGPSVLQCAAHMHKAQHGIAMLRRGTTHTDMQRSPAAAHPMLHRCVHSDAHHVCAADSQKFAAAAACTAFAAGEQKRSVLLTRCCWCCCCCKPHLAHCDVDRVVHCVAPVARDGHQVLVGLELRVQAHLLDVLAAVLADTDEAFVVAHHHQRVQRLDLRFKIDRQAGNSIVTLMLGRQAGRHTSRGGKQGRQHLTVSTALSTVLQARYAAQRANALASITNPGGTPTCSLPRLLTACLAVHTMLPARSTLLPAPRLRFSHLAAFCDLHRPVHVEQHLIPEGADEVGALELVWQGAALQLLAQQQRLLKHSSALAIHLS